MNLIQSKAKRFLARNQSQLDLYCRLLQQCVKNRCIAQGKQLHAHILKTGMNADVTVTNNILNMYVKTAHFQDARQLFDEMSIRDSVSYNSMISACSRKGLANSALLILNSMQADECTKPNRLSFSGAVTANLEWWQLTEVHGQVIKSGFASDGLVASNLAGAYVGLGNFDYGCKVFDEIVEPDIVSWNSLITNSVQNGFYKEALSLFCWMQVDHIVADEFTVTSLLRCCGSLKLAQQGKCFHAVAVKYGYESDIYVANALIDSYAKVGAMEDALKVFHNIAHPNEACWNSVIFGCGLNGLEKQGLELFFKMKDSGMNPDSFTLSCALKICAILGDLGQGRCVHAHIIKFGLRNDIVLESGLIDMYAKCGMVEHSKEVFKNMCRKDFVSWSSMMAGYVRNCQEEEALKLFYAMYRSNTKPDSSMFSISIKACARLLAVEKGHQIQSFLIKLGYQTEVDAGSALVDMYAKCGRMDEAQRVFEEMPEKNEVTWTAALTGYVQNGYPEKSLLIFHDMISAGNSLDAFSFAGALSASASIVALENGRQIHVQVIKSGFSNNVFVSTALLDMYAKCGSLEDALSSFNSMPERNTVSWNSIIMCHAQNSLGKTALELFRGMQAEEVSADHVTFVAVLTACSHAGLLNESYCYFHSMSKDYGIIPKMEHYACMVDVLCRAGCLEAAEGFINDMPIKPDVPIWRTLLSACKIHKNIESGIRAACTILDAVPDDAATYVLLVSMYSEAARWDDAAKVKKIMTDRDLYKDPGCSRIQIKNKVYTFFAEEIS